MINKLIILSILVFLLAISFAYAQVIGTWRGYVLMGGSLASDGVYVTAHVDNASAAATSTQIGGGEYAPDTPSGYYSLSVQCTGSKVIFKVCGIVEDNVYEDCTSGPHYNGTQPNFNLTVTKLSDDTSCTYSCACSGGYCCDGASEYTAGNGTGTCQDTACAAATTTVPGGGGGGGGGGVAEEETTTTITETTAEAETTIALATTAETTVETTVVPKTTTPFIPLEIPAIGNWTIIVIAVGVIATVVTILLLLPRRAPVVPPIPV